MKLITVNGLDFIIETDGSNWYYRLGDCLIIMRTVKEMIKAIKDELESKQH
jgi:hypothetical protein